MSEDTKCCIAIAAVVIVFSLLLTGSVVYSDILDYKVDMVKAEALKIAAEKGVKLDMDLDLSTLGSN